MQDDIVLFDDWSVRRERDAYSKTGFLLIVISLGSLLLFSLVGLFFLPYLVIPMVMAVLALGAVVLQWLMIRHNHLVIKKNQIEITNRFCKTTVYPVSLRTLTLELRHHLDPKRGILMKFYDSSGKLVCKYEDMCNAAAPWGFPKTAWENGLTALGIQILDPTGVIKNG